MWYNTTICYKSKAKIKPIGCYKPICLPIRHRLLSWGLINSAECCLCSFDTETRDHFLLLCDFSSQIWRMVFLKLYLCQPLFCTWVELLSWIRQSSPTVPSLLRKVVAHLVVYNLWRKRNNVLHNSHRVSFSVVFRLIDGELRNVISSRRHMKRWRELTVFWIR
ncbi:putative reverse transcriptase zinc-binding domain-containing protein [Arabidopsis thaliana]